MQKQYDVIIIGSGFGGIAAAVNLQKIGITNYLMLERDAEMGGTWWCNSYPGAQVDVESILYSFSFEPYDWSRVFARQHEILKYTNHVIDKYKLRKNCLTNASVAELKYNENEATWTVSTANGNSYVSRFVINASGGLSQPNIPTFKGQEKFKGKTMHTARWDHQFDLNNKKVAIIGSAASAIQVIPAIAPFVEKLTIFQRSAHWILPRNDRALTSLERQTYLRFPSLRKAYREAVYMKMESRIIAFQYLNQLLKTFQSQVVKFIKQEVKDEQLQLKLIPDYTMGCKRILLSDEYYASLNRSNVRLLTKESGIAAFNETGIETIDGQQIEADLIIYATGFHAAEDVVVYPIIGKKGITIQEEWSNHAHAYLGTTVPNFPNLFVLAGPNTGTGHTSAIGMMEAQLEYIVRMLQDYQRKGWQSIEIKASVEKEYNQNIQEQLKKTVWHNGGCKSWYQTESGVITTLYPTFSIKFWRDCKQFKPADHLFTH
jgi:cation diffusion facilitator CzcD-associated flavoprotein CzcO